MIGAIERFADIEWMGDAAGRSLIVDDQHGLDFVGTIGGELRLDRRDIGAAPPIGGQKFQVEFEFLGDAPPQHRELAGLGEQHLVARRQRIDDGRFPGAGARRGKNDHRLFGAENTLKAGKDGIAEFGEFRTAMVQRRHIHGPQDAVRYIGRAWNLKKMPSCMQSHLAQLPGIFLKAFEYHQLAALSSSGGIPSIHKKGAYPRLPTGIAGHCIAFGWISLWVSLLEVSPSETLRLIPPRPAARLTPSAPPPQTASPGASGRPRGRRAITARST